MIPFEKVAEQGQKAQEFVKKLNTRPKKFSIVVEKIMNQQEKRFTELGSLAVFIKGRRFSLRHPWAEDAPENFDASFMAWDVFSSTHKRASGLLDNVDYPYPEELFRAIQFTAEYKEWESLLPLVKGE